MQTILYQGKPGEGGNWLSLTPEFVAPVKRLGYQVRELVTRDEAEQAKAEHFNAALEQAAAVIRAELGLAAGAPLVRKLMAAKLSVKVGVFA